MRALPLLGVALLLNACWTPPSARVQPPGPTRLIQDGIRVKSVTPHAIVESVDPDRRTLILQTPDDASPRAYKTSLKPSDLTHLPPGTRVRATVTEELTVYVSTDGRPPESDNAPATREPQAKILQLDPSYRLLTLQYSNGQTHTFKVGRHVKLQQMQPGDDVLIQPLAILSVSRLRH